MLKNVYAPTDWVAIVFKQPNRRIYPISRDSKSVTTTVPIDMLFSIAASASFRKVDFSTSSIAQDPQLVASQSPVSTKPPTVNYFSFLFKPIEAEKKPKSKAKSPHVFLLSLHGRTNRGKRGLPALPLRRRDGREETRSCGSGVHRSKGFIHPPAG